jgi:ABC-type Co2+ transport system permease subunit
MEQLIYFFAGLLVAYFFYRLQRDRKKKLREKIEALEAHMEYVSKVRESSEELYRKALMWLFAVLFFVSCGLFIPQFFGHLSALTGFSGLSLISRPIATLSFMAAAIVSASEYRVYSDVLNFEKAVERIQKKKSELERKYKDS